MPIVEGGGVRSCRDSAYTSFQSIFKADIVRLAEIAERLGCVMKGDGDVEITGVVGIEEAGPGHLTFVSNPKYAAKARTTTASAIIVSADFPDVEHATLRSPNPYLTFAQAVELFYEAPKSTPGVNPSARIADSASIGE